MAPHAALAEIGVDYELVSIERDEAQVERRLPCAEPPRRRADARRRRSRADRVGCDPAHPRRPVPGGAARARRAGGLLPLADLHDEHRSRPRSSDSSTPSATAARGVEEVAGAEAASHFDLIDAHLEGREWLVGDHRTAADLFLLMLTRWGRRLDPPAWDRPHLRAHFRRTYELPGVQRMFEEEDLERPDWA